MLGLSFPPVPTGILAFVAFVPLFLLFSTIEMYAKGFRYAYFIFLVFNVLTLYWAGGFVHFNDWYMVAAGALLLVAHPLFFCVPVLAWMFFRKQFGFRRSLYVFPFIWVAFEYAHSSTQVAFPWLILGNTQTYDLSAIQFASITGVYGVTFWILLINVLIFILFAKVSVGDWKKFSVPSIGLAFLILLLHMVPRIYGGGVLEHAEKEVIGDPVRVGLVQPNIDPFEKWQDEPDRQVRTLRELTADVAQSEVDLIIWPETAIPYYILHPNNWHAFEGIKKFVDSIRVPLLTGIPDIKFLGAEEESNTSTKVSKDGERYLTFNSSMLLIPGIAEIQKYAKIILVPFAERVPFSDALRFLNAMRWNFGLGGWNIGPDTTIFSVPTHLGDDAKFSNLICYESIYPGFVATFVRKGAQFLTVVTNDSWWGNTSGAYQHKQFAVMRAVENRRWIIQCANGGISFFTSPYGQTQQATDLYTQRTIVGEIIPRTDLTFYTRQGDWFAEVCLLISGFLIIAAVGSRFYFHVRTRQ